MGIIQRQGFKGTLVSYFGILIGYVNLIFLFPYVFTSEQIGLTRVLVDAVMVFSMFAHFGMPNTLIRFYPSFKSEDDPNQKGFLFAILAVSVFGLGGFTLLYALLREQLLAPFVEKNPLLIQYSGLLVPLTWFMVLSLVLEAYATTFQRIVVPKILREFVLRLLATALALAFLFSWLDFSRFMTAYVLSYGLTTVLLVFYIINQGRWNLRPDFSLFKPSFLKEVGMYSLTIIIGGAGASIVNKIDTLMLSAQTGLSKTGVYSIAFFIATLIEIPMRALLQIASPIVAEAIAKEDRAHLNELYSKGSIIQLIAGIFLFLIIWANADSLFQIMPHGDEYAAGKWVIFFIGLGKLFDLATSINSTLISNSKYYRVNLLFIVLLSALAIGTNLWLIPLLGITGAAVATFISYLVYNSTIVWFVWWKFRLQPFSVATIKLVFIGLLMYGFQAILPHFGSPIVNMLWRSLLLTGIYAMLVYRARLSEDVNSMADKLIKGDWKGMINS